jgi:hypothetical protein
VGFKDEPVPYLAIAGTGWPGRLELF